MLQFNDGDICISALTLQTSAGVNRVQTLAAIGAGITGFFDYPNYSPVSREISEDEPYNLSAAFCNYIDLELSGKERLYELMKRPILDIVEEANLSRSDMSKTALWFALPSKDPAIDALKLEKGFLDEIIRHLVLPPFLDIAAIQSGSTGIYQLIHNAKALLSNAKAEHVIIVGVDSFFIDGRLEYYDKQWRLKTERNPFGFIAGEAGVALLVEKIESAKKREIQPLLGVANIGSGMESNVILNDKNSTGGGLSDAFEKFNPDTPYKWVISDLNGESYRAYEWGLVSVRLRSLFHPDLTLDHFADSIGEIGAATAGVQIACAAQAFMDKSGPDNQAVIFSGNYSGVRSVMHVGAID